MGHLATHYTLTKLVWNAAELGL